MTKYIQFWGHPQTAGYWKDTLFFFFASSRNKFRGSYFFEERNKVLGWLENIFLNEGLLAFLSFRSVLVEGGDGGGGLAASEETGGILVQDAGTITIHICSGYTKILDLFKV